MCLRVHERRRNAVPSFWNHFARCRSRQSDLKMSVPTTADQKSDRRLRARARWSPRTKLHARTMKFISRTSTAWPSYVALFPQTDAPEKIILSLTPHAGSRSAAYCEREESGRSTRAPRSISAEIDAARRYPETHESRETRWRLSGRRIRNAARVRGILSFFFRVCDRDVFIFLATAFAKLLPDIFGGVSRIGGSFFEYFI